MEHYLKYTYISRQILTVGDIHWLYTAYFLSW